MNLPCVYPDELNELAHKRTTTHVMDTVILSHLIRTLISLLAIATVIACDAAGGSYDPSVDNAYVDEAYVGTANNANDLYGKSVPENVISSQDGSATVQAVRDGLDVTNFLINTSFSCYERNAIDYSQPFVTLTVSGTNFSSSLGNGTIDYDQSYQDFAFVGGPFDSDEATYIYFDEYGQLFVIEINGRDHHCFQHGASLERAFHRFLLNTPEIGDYNCRHVDSSDQQTITLAEGGVYYTAQGAGNYVYRNIVNTLGTELEFSGGPLSGVEVDYEENALTGQQEFRISATQNFGIAAGSSTSLTYVCSRFRTPRPYKQYGYATASLAPSPSISLDGFYFAADIEYGGDTSYFYADYYNFRADGFMRRNHPNSIGDDCNRTQPNGLNYCDTYTIIDDRLSVTLPNGITRSYPIRFNNAGQISSISGESVDLITPFSSAYVEGAWDNLYYSQSGCGVTGSCTYSYSVRTYALGLNGRFYQGYNRSGGSTIEAPLTSTVYSASNASNDSVGNYEIRGNRLLLTFDNGTIANHFIFINSFNWLVVDGLLYLPPSDS